MDIKKDYPKTYKVAYHLRTISIILILAYTATAMILHIPPNHYLTAFGMVLILAQPADNRPPWEKLSK